MSTDPRSSPGGTAVPRPVLHPVEWTVQSGAVDDVLRAMNGSLARRRRRRFAAAGAVAIAFVAAVLVWQHEIPLAPEAVPVRSAIVRMPARQVLSDGSIVELRHGARIATEFTAVERRVVLVQGEAHFQVAKNPSRPFVVAVAGMEVRAVGTAFSVQLDSASVAVLVTEGRVAVDTPPVPRPVSTAPPPVVLDAGYCAVIELPSVPTAPAAPAPHIAAVAPAEMDARLAWRAPRIEFSGTPLSDALTLINRYNAVRTVLADPTLGHVRVSGILRADNSENLWRLLEEQHGIRAEHRGETEVVLSRSK